MSYLAINSTGEDENSDDEASADTAEEVRSLVRDVAQRDDVPQDLRQRAQALTGR
ncbi:hypothetical protein ACFVUH_16020 [Kitasatospora sp. NPDC058032]|uniref:hypothetical protein n=1 Tax=Kitasatospora sp. NPDC058032 TaxID=3346307 RepID=UPI0036DE494B